MTAILLYARATATSGSKSERGSVQLDASKLLPEQQADHDMIIRLRNGVIGHVAQGARIAGDLWHRDSYARREAGGQLGGLQRVAQARVPSITGRRRVGKEWV